MLPVTIVDFCYGWTLWLFLTWIPAFFFENYHQNLQASALFSGGVLLAGVIGDTMGGVVSDRLLRKTGSLVIARRGVIVAGFLGAFVFLIPVVLIHNLTVAAVCLSLAFFFAELIVGPIWSVPMDIAPRYAGTASGMMNFGFAIAGLISPSSFGYLVDRTGSWVMPFIASIVLLLLGAVLALRLRPGSPVRGRAVSRVFGISCSTSRPELQASRRVQKFPASPHRLFVSRESWTTDGLTPAGSKFSTVIEAVFC